MNDWLPSSPLSRLTGSLSKYQLYFFNWSFTLLIMVHE